MQALWAFATNAYFKGFAEGKIYSGKLKNICVPGMNCYSCPGALGSCPIGSLQATIGSGKFNLSFYVAGFLILTGALIGRFVCGFLCPFGLIQDLLHKIPFPKKIKSFKADKPIRYLKYIILAVFVILLPMFWVDIIGEGEPYFCKLICPVGALEGGVPLVLMNKALQSAIGFLYAQKITILIITLLLSIIIYRPFCKYICPLGAIYSLFNKIAVFKYRLDPKLCINCGACKAVCEMNVDLSKDCNSAECIRCGNCIKICPKAALSVCGICGKGKKIKEKDDEISGIS